MSHSLKDMRKYSLKGWPAGGPSFRKAHCPGPTTSIPHSRAPGHQDPADPGLLPPAAFFPVQGHNEQTTLLLPSQAGSLRSQVKTPPSFLNSLSLFKLFKVLHMSPFFPTDTPLPKLSLTASYSRCEPGSAWPWLMPPNLLKPLFYFKAYLPQHFYYYYH